MSVDFEECLPYKKKSQAKPPKKSKHKHEYEPCVLEFYGCRLDQAHGFVYDEPRVKFNRYCLICGKLGGLTSEDIGRWHKPGHYPWWVSECLTEEGEKELNPTTRTLPTFWVDDPYSPKYVEVGK